MDIRETDDLRIAFAFVRRDGACMAGRARRSHGRSAM
jgi:hypothetical protein